MGKKTMSNRIYYFDSLRLIAMTIIYVTHFYEDFKTMIVPFMQKNYIILIMERLSGKFGVCIFGILLGYFAFLTNDNNSTRYVIKRYAYFFVSGFLINGLYALAGFFLSGFKSYNILEVVVESIRLGSGIYPNYWCILPFFVASLLSYLNGKLKVSGIVILMEIFVFILRSDIWVAICLMGNLLAKYKDFDCAFVKKRVVRVLLWIVLIAFSFRLESRTTYLIFGICSATMIYLIMHGTIEKKLLNHKFMGAIGEKGMGVFLLHPLLYTIFGPLFFNLFVGLSNVFAFFLSMILCYVIIIILSFPSVRFIQWFTNFVVGITIKIQNYIETRTKYHNEV